MCNLFGSRAGWSELVEAFADAGAPIVSPGPEAAPNLPPRDEVWPTDPAPVVRAAPGGTALSDMRWGFVTAGVKRPPVINFRSEGRRFAPEQRCLVPVSEFYEFTGTKAPKTKWRFTQADGAPWFCFAGLWRKDEGSGERFTLLSCAPGPDVAPIHDRQLVIVERADWAGWLSGEGTEAEVLQPSAAGSLTVEQVRP